MTPTHTERRRAQRASRGKKTEEAVPTMVARAAPAEEATKVAEDGQNGIGREGWSHGWWRHGLSSRGAVGRRSTVGRRRGWGRLGHRGGIPRGARASGRRGELTGADGVGGGRPRRCGDVVHGWHDEDFMAAMMRGGRE